uniref:Pancreatic trypsin inhibitor n=1 Tax=Rhipicephalus appendiculatus TaxID=34631 RepID=A0A131YZ93_RHIAP
MKTSCSFLILLISAALMYDATLAGLFSMRKRKAPSNCLKPPYLGKCNRTINAWYFDPTKGWCKMFTYGPCGGGANNFRYELECLRHCRQKQHPKILCSLPPKAKQCWGSSRQWYFDTTTNTCKMFQRSLCAENANGFSSCQKCLYRCSSKKAGDACLRSSVQGQTSVWLPPQQSQAAGISNQIPAILPLPGQPEAPRGGQGNTYSPQIITGNGIATFPTHQGRPQATGGWQGPPYPPHSGVITTKPAWPPQQGPSSTYGGSHLPPIPPDRWISGPPTWPPNHGRSQTPTGPPSQPYPPSSPVSNITPVTPPASNGKSEVYNTSMYAALTPV